MMKKLHLAVMVVSLLATMIFLGGSALAQSSDALVVDETGRVGIGTTDPAATLEVYHNGFSDGLYPSIALGNTPLGQGYSNRIYVDSVGSPSGNFPSLRLRHYNGYYSSTITSMFIDGYNGNVGIGTTSPSAGLTVSRASDARLDVVSQTSGYATVRLISNNANYGSIDSMDSSYAMAKDLVFQANGGNVGIGATQFGTNAAKVLGLRNGTAPTSSPLDMVQLYAVDAVDGDGTATSELFVRDEDGNAVDLSPHMFALFQPEASEPLPWAYYSENTYLGKVINVDMAGAIRAIERLSGKQFIFYKDIPKAEVQKEKREEWKKDWIAKNTTEQEVSKDKALEAVEVMVEDTTKVVSEKVTYALEGRNVIEVRTPVYAQKAEQKWQLRNGARFDTNTGKFLMKKEPTEAEAEAAASAQFQLVVKKWIRDRM
jgi:hypothetical protein